MTDSERDYKVKFGIPVQGQSEYYPQAQGTLTEYDDLDGAVFVQTTHMGILVDIIREGETETWGMSYRDFIDGRHRVAEVRSED